jgi:hypothetical protein
LFQTRGDERAGTLQAADQTLIEQHFQRLAGGDPGDTQLLAEVALGRHRLLGLPLPGMDRRFQIARQLQVQRRRLGVIWA